MCGSQPRGDAFGIPMGTYAVGAADGLRVCPLRRGTKVTIARGAIVKIGRIKALRRCAVLPTRISRPLDESASSSRGNSAVGGDVTPEQLGLLTHC